MFKNTIIFILLAVINIPIFLLSSNDAFTHGSDHGSLAQVKSKKQASSLNREPVNNLVENGIAIDFGIRPLAKQERILKSDSVVKLTDTLAVVEDIHVGEEAIIYLIVKDAFTGAPIKGLLPDSFIQLKPFANTEEEIEASIDRCRYRALKRGRMHGGHPPLLENTYVISLNSLDNTLSIINPLLRPKTIIKKIPLSEKCVDMFLEEYGSDLYITCETGKVIVIDCNRLEISKIIDVGLDPFHIAFQPDSRYVWVCNDGDSTVSVIDTNTQSVVKNVAVGKGHHEITFSDDSFFAYVTNNDEDSITIIDINSLIPIQTIKTGSNPHGLAYSTLSQCVYIANEGSDTISVMDTVRNKIVNTIKVGKGVRTIAFGEDGRFCFALNRMANSVSIIDISRDKVLKTIPTGIRPESIVLSSSYAYIRNVGSPEVTIIKLSDMTGLGEVSIGEVPPNSVEIKRGHLDIGASYMVIIPNPADDIVYTLMIGDNETAFKYRTKGKGPTKIAFFWKGFKEIAPGIYMQVAKFDKPGRHEVGFFIDSPETTACFEVNVISRNDS